MEKPERKPACPVIGTQFMKLKVVEYMGQERHTRPRLLDVVHVKDEE